MVFSAILLSCSKVEEGAPGSVAAGTDEVTFTSAITRSSKTEFDARDVIYVSASDAQTASYTLGTDGIFTSSDPIMFQSVEDLSFKSIYPSTAAESLESPFAFAAEVDQSAGLVASDLLVAKVEATQSRTPDLDFAHVMSQIKISVSTGESLILRLSMQNGATIDIDSESYVGDGVVGTLTPYNPSEREFEAIVAPQTLVANETVAILDMGGATLAWIPTEDIEFKSGYLYEFDWDVVENDVNLVATTQISAWTAGSANEYSLVDGLVSKTDPEWSDIFSDGTYVSVLGADAAQFGSDSDFASGMYLFNNIWDGVYNSNTGTDYWHSSGGGGGATAYNCFTVDLGKEYALTQMFLGHRGSYNRSSHQIQYFNLYGATEITDTMISAESSTSGVAVWDEWTPLMADAEFSSTETLTTGGLWFDIPTQADGSYASVRYVRFEVTGTFAGTSINVGELDFMAQYNDMQLIE